MFHGKQYVMQKKNTFNPALVHCVHLQEQCKDTPSALKYFRYYSSTRFTKGCLYDVLLLCTDVKGTLFGTEHSGVSIVMCLCLTKGFLTYEVGPFLFETLSFSIIFGICLCLLMGLRTVFCALRCITHYAHTDSPTN